MPSDAMAVLQPASPSIIARNWRPDCGPATNMPPIRTGKFLERIPFARFGAGDDPVLVINGGQGFMMKPDAERMEKDARRLMRLLPTDRSVILLGYDPDAERVTVERLAEDVARIIEEHFDGKADVVGISYGGVVASRLAARSPGKVGKLVLLASAPWFSPEGERRLRRQIELVADGNMGALLREFTSMFRSPWLNLLVGLRLRLSGSRLAGRLGRPEVIARYLKAMMESGLRENGLFPSDVPALLVGGSRDQFFAQSMAEASTALPHLKMSILEGETHMMPVERAGAVKTIIGEFLRPG